MPFQSVPNTAALRMFLKTDPSLSLGDTEALFTLYFRDDLSTWAPTQLQDLADAGRIWWETGLDGGAALKTLFVSAWNLDKAEAQDLEAVNGVLATAASGSSGTRAGDPLSPSLAVVMQFKGDSGSDAKVGRVFLPAGSESDLSGAFYASGLLTSLQDAFDDLDAGVAATVSSSAARVIVSRYSGTEAVTARRAVRRATAITNTLQSTQARREVGSQRDRRPSA